MLPSPSSSSGCAFTGAARRGYDSQQLHAILSIILVALYLHGAVHGRERTQLPPHTADSIQDSHGGLQAMMGLFTLGRMVTHHDTMGRSLRQWHSAEEDSTWSGHDADTCWHTCSQDRELTPHRHQFEGVVDFITLPTVTTFASKASILGHEALSHRVRAMTATRPAGQPEPDRNQRHKCAAQQLPNPIRAQPDDGVHSDHLTGSDLPYVTPRGPWSCSSRGTRH